ncbi:MAG: ATP-dependent Clp protease ATP-binding subunit, partial [Nonomuraea sp.]|nr:ATP-dependent Clp protease ATP-binding subunit [Nonomuraea sp.]
DDLRNYARYTDKARVAVVKSQEEARLSGHDHIEVGHLVLGLLHVPQALAALTMETLGAPPETVRRAVTEAMGPGGGQVAVTLPFAAQSSKALELTLREALRLGHNYIGTEHLLLGILSLEEGPVVEALAGLGVTKEPAEQEIKRRLEEILRARTS